MKSTKDHDPCSTAREMRETRHRSTQCPGTTSNGYSLCDRNLMKSWYRASDENSYLKLPESCPDSMSCGTTNPIWMKGVHPRITDGIVNRTACVRGLLGSCCENTYQIQVKNCGDFFVYNLRYTNLCDQAYCFGDSSCRTHKPGDVTLPESDNENGSLTLIIVCIILAVLITALSGIVIVHRLFRGNKTSILATGNLEKSEVALEKSEKKGNKA